MSYTEHFSTLGENLMMGIIDAACASSPKMLSDDTDLFMLWEILSKSVEAGITYEQTTSSR
jgi:hypothetical protein